MFKGFIVLGVAYAVGYTQGYLKGQGHTDELKDLLRDLRDSDETKKFIAEARLAVKKLAEQRTVEESEEEEPVADADAEVVVEVPEKSTTQGE